jgi:cell division protein FtsB
MESIQVIIDKFYGHRHKIGTAGIGLFAVLLAFHVFFGANGMLQYQNKRAEFHRTQVEVEQLQAENAEIERQIKALKTDPKTIEKEAREQLKYTRPGEFVYRLPNARPEMNTATASKK